MPAEEARRLLADLTKSRGFQLHTDEATGITELRPAATGIEAERQAMSCKVLFGAARALIHQLGSHFFHQLQHLLHTKRRLVQAVSVDLSLPYDFVTQNENAVIDSFGRGMSRLLNLEREQVVVTAIKPAGTVIQFECRELWAAISQERFAQPNKIELHELDETVAANEPI